MSTIAGIKKEKEKVTNEILDLVNGFYKKYEHEIVMPIEISLYKSEMTFFKKYHCYFKVEIK